ncbi:BglG family transcription antiterminator [Priestia taiwanensis]|uniref:Transcriptional antiterminator n=1 Tax=Priestia taiwanensis TaxID=1347902 RepID=A0A917AVK5_9BACI|nr:HTH domain-containing protein [Priestia taiwanensis]MBM7364814.1 transcriptional antiterminator [Priestia taiwanensis]GGE79901.1 transcriptional antiterminator [Priestia taiwanensis]
MLTMREYQIVTKLLEVRNEIRIKDLSTEFGVSTRTIKYDLNNVKYWFRQHELDFHSQPNKGIWIACSEAKRMEAKHAIMQMERRKLYPNQDVRVRRLISILALTVEYVTANELAERLEVSRNTILSDLQFVEEMIEPWMVTLERKQRTGYKIYGEEIHVRLLLEHIIQTELSNYDIYQIMTRMMKKETQDIHLIIEDQLVAYYHIVEKHMTAMFDSPFMQQFNHSELLTTLLRLTISLTRLQLGFTVKTYKLLHTPPYKDNHTVFLLTLMKITYEEACFPLLEDEYLYVSGAFEKETNQMDIAHVTEQIIRYVSEQEGINYKQDSRLYSNLLAHLSLRFQKGTMHISEFNPFTEEIKRNHTSLFHHIRKACQTYITTRSVSAQDSFIAFLALHFLVSYENTFKKKQRARALYVCSTGRGVAKLLKSRVEREVPDIDIVAYCSMMEIEDICKREEVDLIVSIFPITADVPVIVVEALPTKRDINAIRQQVENVNKRESPRLQGSFVQSHKRENSEEISQEIILKGCELTQELVSLFGPDLEESRKNAFMMHVCLLVHRCYFEQQYEYTGRVEACMNERATIIRRLFFEKDLKINEAEITALVQYMN